MDISIGCAGCLHKKVIGYQYGLKMTRELVIEALKKALQNQGNPKNLILHSDRGSQYTSHDYTSFAKEMNISLSFSKKGCPYDNAVMESFNVTLKKEEVYQNKYETFNHASLALYDYIEGFYNRVRTHGSIGFLSPIQFERTFN